MTVETETVLIKLLEELKADFKEARKDLTDIKVNQARLEGKIDTLEVKLEEKTTALQKGQDAINTKLNVQNTWQLSLITGLVLGLQGIEGY